MSARIHVQAAASILACVSLVLIGGCPGFNLPGTGDPNCPEPNCPEPNCPEPNCPDCNDPNGSATGTRNTTDKTNDNAKYIGSDACRECHAQIADYHRVHGHAFKINPVNGAPPVYPTEGIYAGVPNPPDGFDWSDIAYIIGGYTKKGRFIDQDGYILITGLEGVDTQWNLEYPPNGTVPSWAPYEGSRDTPKPYGHSCFECHTTGPLPQDEDTPLFQENRPGFEGTWEEPGIQCEACHGPGGNHFTSTGTDVMVDRSKIYVDPDGSETCNQCHNRPFDDQTGVILAKSSGYIKHHEQYPELKASGGHAGFTCVTCHSPHRSTVYDVDNAFVIDCTDCHEGHDMARHDGAVFVRGDYSETMSCKSCHMPFASTSATVATTDVVGDLGRMGDTRTHIFRIDTRAVDFNSMFATDFSEVLRDDQDRAAVTLDFVCLRCHNGIGNAFALPDVATAAGIAPGLHD